MEQEDGRKQYYPAKWIQWLINESASWVNSGVITEEQRNGITGIYIPEGSGKLEERKNERFIAVISVLGAILLGLGVILFFASNWKAIPVGGKLTLIFGLTIITYAVGYWLAYERKSFPRVGNSLIFLGVIFFGAGIWLVAQIFHIKADYPLGQLVWALAGLAAAVTLRQKSILALSVVLLCIWNVLQQTQNAGYNFLFPALIFLAIIPLAVRMQSRLTAVLGVVGLTIWVIVNVSMDEVGLGSAAAIVMMLFLSLYALAYSGEKFLREGRLHSVLNFIFVLGVLISGFMLTFKDIEWEWLPSYTPEIYAGILLTILVLSTIYNVFLKHGRKRGNIIENVAIIAAAVYLLTFISGLYSSLIFTITFNIVYALLMVGMVYKGFAERKVLYINTALVFFVLDVIARYFDYAWKLIDRSVFFMAGGIILLAGSILLEKWRRKVTGELKVMNYEA